MKTAHIVPVLLGIAALLFAAGCDGHAAGIDEPASGADREYTLRGLMVGYIGQGGEIDGVKNPVLHAHPGETVTLILINGENMVHDIALRRHRVRSEILAKAEEVTRLTFVAETDDTYYCTLPGHLEAGMAGEFAVTPRPGTEPQPARTAGQTTPSADEEFAQH